MAVDGLGRRAIGANRSAHAKAMAADLDHLGLQVGPENVVQVRNVLLGEATRLSLALSWHSRDLRVGRCGTDPVSEWAERGFNQKIDGLKADMKSYIDALAAAADVLKQTAQAYGHTEAEIEGSFQRYSDSRSAQWQQQLTHRGAVQSLPSGLRPLADFEPKAPEPSPLDMFRRP